MHTPHDSSTYMKIVIDLHSHSQRYWPLATPVTIRRSDIIMAVKIPAAHPKRISNSISIRLSPLSKSGPNFSGTYLLLEKNNMGDLILRLLDLGKNHASSSYVTQS